VPEYELLSVRAPTILPVVRQRFALHQGGLPNLDLRAAFVGVDRLRRTVELKAIIGILEDDAAVRESLQLMLELHGYRVDEFEDGARFLARALRQYPVHHPRSEPAGRQRPEDPVAAARAVTTIEGLHPCRHQANRRCAERQR